MKKIKISELPLYNSLKGLFTIGTDSQNRSVKVSLEFVEDETNKAVKNAENATKTAITATNNANDATKKSLDATQASNTATKESKEATDKAITSTKESTEATSAANKATSAANVSATNASLATDESKTVTAESKEATKASLTATEQVLNTLGILVPTGLKISYSERLTFGNVQPVYIRATLSPITAMKNILFISDNNALSVSTDGRLSIIRKGRSIISVIPTCNTALSKTILIEVGDPTLRKIAKKELRFTQSGRLRFN